MIARPTVSIEDVAIRADWIDGVATLRVQVKTNQPESAHAIQLQLVETQTLLKANETSTIANVLAWTAETPNLYTLRVSSAIDSQEGETVEVKFGFRTVTIEDSMLKVNGVPIQLRS